MGIGSMALFCGIVFIAAFVQGISGFAFSMIVLMVLPYLFGYTSALALASLMAVLLLIENTYLYRKYCNWQWVPLCAIVSALADAVGILVLKRVGDNPIWYTLMGVIFIIMAVYLLWGQGRLRIQATRKTLILFSLISGLIVGAFGVGGPIIAAFFLEACKSKEEYLGTMQVICMCSMLIDVFLRAINGMYSLALCGYALLSVVFLVTGLILAKRVVEKMDALTMRRIICVVMAVNGVVLLLR